MPQQFAATLLPLNKQLLCSLPMFVFAFAIVLCMALPHSAVAQYPSTQYQSISNSVDTGFATSSPMAADPHPNDFSSSHQAMSPDSWGSTAPPTQNQFIPQNQFPPQQSVFAPQNAPTQTWESEPVTSQTSSPQPQSSATGLKSVYETSNQPAANSENAFRPASHRTNSSPSNPQAGTIEGKFSNAGFRSPAQNQPGQNFAGSQYTQPNAEPSNVQLSQAPFIPQSQSWIPSSPGAVYQPPQSIPVQQTDSRYPLMAGPTNYQGDPGHVDSNQGWSFPEQTGFQTSPVVSAPYQLPPMEMQSSPTLPAFNPQQLEPTQSIFEQTAVGQRKPWPTQRGTGVADTGEKFDFETKKKEYPPMSEILATGRYFGSVEMLYLKPHFQGNTAIATEAPGFGESIPFQFDREIQPRFRLGFESKYGPGVEMSYMNINTASEFAEFTSNGAISGQTSVWMLGPNEWSRIAADAAGETITAQHNVDLDSFTVSFFKELKFPISRLNGNFGFQYVSIFQELNANVNDAGGAIVDSIVGTSDMRAFGPRAILEYYRPIGHTPFEFVTSFGGSVMFGERDQFINNTATGQLNRVAADEFITVAEYSSGVQYKKMTGENRAWFGRLAFVNQTWIGGGTAVLPQDDFGMRGLTFTIGYNR